MKMTVGAAAAFALLAASSAAEAADPAVALVLGVKGSPFYQALACGAKAKAKELGPALTISAPDQFAADSQIPVVNAIAATTPAVAAIVPTDAKALIAPMKRLAERGTKILTID
jgi:ribose transport system substrate-binding protein